MPYPKARNVLLWLMSIAYLVAGILHMLMPKPFLAITPNWVPWPQQVIFFTGLCEIAGAIGLHIPYFRRSAALGLALYAVCVFPANINHAFGTLPDEAVHLGWLYHAPRLALQPVLVWLALFAGGVIDWPFRRARVDAAR